MIYCFQQTIACRSGKRFVTALRLVSVNLYEFILAAVLRSAALCI